MSTLTDTEVRERREATPWARLDFERFVRDVALNGASVGDGNVHQNNVVFTAHYRPNVSSCIWYELEWTGGDGERHKVWSQYFDLLMWRAANAEIKARQAAAIENDAQSGRVA